MTMQGQLAVTTRKIPDLQLNVVYVSLINNFCMKITVCHFVSTFYLDGSVF